MRKRLERRTPAVISLWMKVFGLFFCISGIASSPGYALWIGQSQVNPLLEVKGVYESNIYQADTAEESDFITIISPGIHFEFPTGQQSSIKAVADYRADIKMYGNDGDGAIDPNGQLNTTDHRLGGHITFDLPTGLLGKLGYVYNMTSTPPDFIGDTRNDYTQHQLEGRIGYRFADLYKVEFGYDGRFKSFDDEMYNSDDITSHIMEVAGFYQIQPRVSALVGGSYGTFDRKSPFYDSTEYRAFGGFEYEATENTKGVVKVGYATRQFDSSPFDDATGVYVDGHLTSNYQDRTQWTLKLFRHYNDTAVSDQTADNGTYSVNTGFGGNIRHGLATLPNMSLLGGLNLSRETYPDDTGDREDTLVDANIGFDYKFYRYISLGASYNYKNRDSNIDERNYTNHIAIMKIQGLI